MVSKKEMKPASVSGGLTLVGDTHGNERRGGGGWAVPGGRGRSLGRRSLGGRRRRRRHEG